MGLAAIGKVWLHTVANLIGGALAAIVYRVVNPEEYRN
jgi:glycerol uptake facilitator-like aquaporin